MSSLSEEQFEQHGFRQLSDLVLFLLWMRGMHMCAAGRKVLLVNPPIHATKGISHIWTLDYAPNFPLAVLRLSSYFKGKGDDVKYLDAFFPVKNQIKNDPVNPFPEDWYVRDAPMGNFEYEGKTKPVYRIGLPKDEIVRRLKTIGPLDDIYISSIFTWSWQITHETVSLCKETHPEATVHLGGIYPTLVPDLAKKSDADEVFVGEMPELDTEYPDLSLFATDPPNVSILKTSLGCPNACTYCAVSLLEGRKFRYREPELIADEIRYINSRYGIRHFQFWESNLLLKPHKHWFPMVEAINRIGIPLEFLAPEGIQVDLVTEDIARSMYELGFRNIYLSIETTDDEWAKATNRPVGFEDLKKAIDCFKKAGFRREQLLCVLLVGMPGQSRRSILRDILSIYSLGCSIWMNIYTMIPGTQDFVTMPDLLAGRPLEDLDPLLFPFASKVLTVEDMEKIIRFFNWQTYPVERIQSSKTDDPIIREMQSILADGDMPL